MFMSVIVIVPICFTTAYTTLTIEGTDLPFEVDCDYLKSCARYLNIDVKGLDLVPLFIPQAIINLQERSTACLNDSMTTKTLAKMTSSSFLQEIYKCVHNIQRSVSLCEQACLNKADRYSYSEFFGSKIRQKHYNRCIRICDQSSSSPATITGFELTTTSINWQAEITNLERLISPTAAITESATKVESKEQNSTIGHRCEKHSSSTNNHPSCITVLVQTTLLLYLSFIISFCSV